MKTIAQLLGFKCRHSYLSRPRLHDGHLCRTCTACGTHLDNGTVVEHRVTHHVTQSSSITRVGNSILRFRKRKEQSK